MSLPMRGRGLKYEYIKGLEIGRDVAPHAGAWIEILSRRKNSTTTTSLPMRGAWIEMVIRSDMQNTVIVAPHGGSVD